MKFNIGLYPVLLIQALLSSLLLSSCTNSNEKKLNSTNKNMEVQNIYELSEQQQADWNMLFKDWQVNHFENCLEANNFKMDCVDCGSIYLEGTLTIGENGNLVETKMIKEEIDCLQDKNPQQIEKLKKCMMAFFKNHTFPHSLRNISINARIGRVTRC